MYQLKHGPGLAALRGGKIKKPVPGFCFKLLPNGNYQQALGPDPAAPSGRHRLLQGQDGILLLGTIPFCSLLARTSSST